MVATAGRHCHHLRSRKDCGDLASDGRGWAAQIAPTLPLRAAAQAAPAGSLRADKRQLVADNVVCAVGSLWPLRDGSHEVEAAVEGTDAGSCGSSVGLQRTVAAGAVRQFRNWCRPKQ